MGLCSTNRGAVFVLMVIFLCAGCPPVLAQEQDAAGETSELVDFYITARPNYEGAQWVISERTEKIIGYAPWNPIQRRWTLFSLRGTYEGFIQATMGEAGFGWYRSEKEVRSNLQENVAPEEPPFFTQYLWYDKHNRYKGLFVPRLGGRPPTYKLPYGELGGQLIYYAKGDIQSEPPPYQLEVHPLRRLMRGIETKPIDPTITPMGSDRSAIELH